MKGGIYGGVPPVVASTVGPCYKDLLSTKVYLENSQNFGDPMGTSSEKDLDLFTRGNLFWEMNLDQWRKRGSISLPVILPAALPSTKAR